MAVRSLNMMAFKSKSISLILAFVVIIGSMISLTGCSSAPPKAVETPDKTAGKDTEDNKSAMPGNGPQKDK